MITLPAPRAIYLKSFGLVAGLGAGLSIVVLSLLIDSRTLLVFGMAAMPLAIAGATLRPEAWAPFYRVWNRAAHEFSRIARLCLLGICFYIVLVTVGRAGSALRFHRPGARESLWLKRQSAAPTDHSPMPGARGKSSSAQGWTRSYVGWAARSRNLWTCCLLPFFILLSVLEPEQENTVPTDLYTLF